jgi:leucine rich repeat (LRR) protein
VGVWGCGGVWVWKAVNTGPEYDKLFREAADPATSPARLTQIVKAEHARLRRLSGVGGPERSNVLKAVAANPSAPPEVLRELLPHCPDSFLSNPVVPLLLLEAPDFLDTVPADTLKRILMREAVPPLLLASLSRHRDPEVAGTARLHVGLAGEAGGDWEAEVRAALRSLRDTPSAELVELAEVGLAPPFLVELLAGHQNHLVRQAVLLGRAGGPLQANLADLLRRASGSPDLSTLEEPDPTLEPEALARLALGGMWARTLAARHSNTPRGALERLAADPDKFVRLRVARNPSAPSELLEHLAGTSDEALRIAVARNERVPPGLLARLAHDASPRVRASAARNPAAPPESLSSLAADGDVSVRNAVARHPRTPPARLRELAGDPEAVVRQGVASNVEAPEAVLELLAADSTLIVRETLLRRADLPAALRHRLEQPAGRGTGILPVFQERGTGFQPVEPGITGRMPVPQSAEALHRLALDSNAAVRAAVAANPSAAPETLIFLADDDEHLVRSSLAGNRNAPERALVKLLNQYWSSWEVLARLARHPRIPLEWLSSLAGNSMDPVRQAAAANPHLPLETLLKLAEDTAVGVRRAVLHHRNASPQVGRRIRATVLRQGVVTAPAHTLYRFIIVSHPEVSRREPQRLEEFAFSVEWPDRLAAVLNPAAPASLYARLTEDGNRLVRAAARARVAGARTSLLGW